MLLPYLLDSLFCIFRFSFFSFFDAGTHHKVCRRSCDEERRTCTDDNTQHHGEGESTDAITTEHEDHQQHDERRYRGVDGTCESAVQCIVEDALTVTLWIVLEDFTDTVEDDHLVVDGVTDHRQDSTNECLVNLE